MRAATAHSMQKAAENEVRIMDFNSSSDVVHCVQDVESTKRPSKAAQYTGWEASSRAINVALERERPIDGILGAALCLVTCIAINFGLSD